MRSVWAILATALGECRRDRVQHLAAAIGFYALFALAPLIVLSLLVSGAILGPEAAAGRFERKLAEWAGPETAVAIQDVLRVAQPSRESAGATLVSVVVLAFVASGMLSQLTEALNIIFGERGKGRGQIAALVRKRSYGLAMVGGFGLLVFLSLLSSFALGSLGSWASELVPANVPFLKILDGLASLLLTAAFLAMVYRWIPERKVEWRTAWVAALTASLLFLVGKNALALYIARSGIFSFYGAAASFVIAMIWVFFAVLAVLYGAEVGKVHARSRE